MKPAYEPGMKIAYDPVSHRIVVSFRGRITVLPDTANTQDEATSVGEKFCRQHGWKPEDVRPRGVKIRSLW